MKRIVILSLLTLALCGFLACKDKAGDGQKASGAEVGAPPMLSGAAGVALATINGVPVTDEDIMPLVKGSLQRIDQKVYEIKKDALDEVINQKLVETAAKAKGQTVEQYLIEQIDDKIAQPKPEEVKSFFDARKAQDPEKTFKEMEPKIKEYLFEARRNAYTQKLIATLRETSEIIYNVAVPRIDINFDGYPSRGPSDAKVTMVEFADYQCPYCSRTNTDVKKVLEKYGDKMKFVFIDFPLPLSSHQFAEKAHEAAHCAGEQGKYWEYADLLWAGQRGLNIEKMKAMAKETGLNVADFNKCLDADKYEDKVREGIMRGNMAGISGTPSFFINGVALSGAVPLGSIEQTIEEELKK